MMRKNKNMTGFVIVLDRVSSRVAGLQFSMWHCNADILEEEARWQLQLADSVHADFIIKEVRVFGLEVKELKDKNLYDLSRLFQALICIDFDMEYWSPLYDSLVRNKQSLYEILSEEFKRGRFAKDDYEELRDFINDYHLN